MKKPLSRWIAYTSLATVLGLGATAAQAFNDLNADLKEAAVDRSARVVVTGKAHRPVQTVWVPAAVKSLDGFQPVLPDERVMQARSRATLLAKAGAPDSAGKR
ncbi:MULTISPECIES: hypothetical protein [unclassified Roseateles]|uniref:hypothetical protein n=1 Tax=unclassified Roseateles TaxID=2626991 RepID=UPI0006F1FAA1|nr:MULTISPECIES: hypothetical protein [unclassified Roseateles]KQW50782.1 hypothetical protein ASC81_24095 [Pelomonas sp. Root405]KRA70859.1 hypothetical protein ASD88_13520 [Pelomonas sp. Root662]